MFNIPLPIYIAFVFFLGGALIMELHHRYRKKLHALPAREEYLAQHGIAHPRCHACGSEDLHEDGCSHGEDTRRIVNCKACKQLLFQFQRDRSED